MIRRLGGKSKLKNKIIELIPQHKIYVEPFVGGGSVFFGKPNSEIEIINDLDTDIYNIFQDTKDVGNTMINKTFIPTRIQFNELKTKTVFIDSSERLFRNLYLSMFSFSGNRITYMSEKSEKKVSKNAS